MDNNYLSRPSLKQRDPVPGDTLFSFRIMGDVRGYNVLNVERSEHGLHLELQHNGQTGGGRIDTFLVKDADRYQWVYLSDVKRKETAK